MVAVGVLRCVCQVRLKEVGCVGCCYTSRLRDEDVLHRLVEQDWDSFELNLQVVVVVAWQGDRRRPLAWQLRTKPGFCSWKLGLVLEVQVVC